MVIFVISAAIEMESFIRDNLMCCGLNLILFFSGFQYLHDVCYYDAFNHRSIKRKKIKRVSDHREELVLEFDLEFDLEFGALSEYFELENYRL